MIPFLAGKVVYPLQEAALKRPTFSYLNALERSQWLSRGEIERLQMAKLGELLRLARDHCPWHRRRIEVAGIDLSKAPTIDDLRALPVTTRADMQNHGAEMVWREVPGGAFRYNTGGSSGEPLIFHFGRWRQASDAAGRMRARRWWGVEVGDPEVYLWGAPVELNKTDRVKTFRDRMINQLVLNAFEMSPAAMDGYLDQIKRFRPRCIYGYASSVALLAAHAEARGGAQVIPTLKVVCTTGEPLYPEQRRLIQDTFGAPVANELGSRDIGFTAHETPRGQMLLMSESIILEVLDPTGRPVASGDVGEAVMTGLCSQAQPFIRYRTGDMMRAGDDACLEGRGLHVIQDVVGRQTDFIVRSDGTIMHALAVIYVVRATEGVAEFKVVQHNIDNIEVLVVPNRGWSETSAAEIVSGLNKRLGPVRAEVRCVDSIPPDASGKHRYVVSHVALPDTLKVASGVN